MAVASSKMRLIHIFLLICITFQGIEAQKVRRVADLCGNGVCEDDETYSSCPNDCVVKIPDIFLPGKDKKPSSPSFMPSIETLMPTLEPSTTGSPSVMPSLEPSTSTVPSGSPTVSPTKGTKGRVDPDLNLCGDDVCDGTETCESCPSDCCPFETANPTMSSEPSTMPSLEPSLSVMPSGSPTKGTKGRVDLDLNLCGDDICDDIETCESCPSDCCPFVVPDTANPTMSSEPSGVPSLEPSISNVPSMMASLEPSVSTEPSGSPTKATKGRADRGWTVCGNNICEDMETCETCPSDCCPAVISETPYPTMTSEPSGVALTILPSLEQSVSTEPSGVPSAISSASPTESVLVSGSSTFCGDGTCQEDETCELCPSDCCPVETPETTYPTVFVPESPSPSSISSQTSEPSGTFAPTISSGTDAPTAPPTLAPTTTMAPTQPVITFFALGDVPYSEQEECLLPYELDKLQSSGYNGQFLVHLGDVRDGLPDPTTGQPRDCPEAMFQTLSSTFSASPMPTFFLSGDTGWLDCTDADAAYDYWESYLFPFNERTDLGWPEFPVTVTRHHTRSEMFSFFMDEVLFLGQSLPERGTVHDVPMRNALLLDNAYWTEQHFIDYAGMYKAVVVMGHDFEAKVNSLYLSLFKTIAQHPYYGYPPILLLQHGKTFEVDVAYQSMTNVVMITTDNTVTPTAITVNPWAAELERVFTYDRRCYCSTGHRPTNLKNWPLASECAGQCDEAHAQCMGADACSPPGATC